MKKLIIKSVLKGAHSSSDGLHPLQQEEHIHFSWRDSHILLQLIRNVERNYPLIRRIAFRRAILTWELLSYD